jgi:RimJ/RimL family protein N-acetyltransferase
MTLVARSRIPQAVIISRVTADNRIETERLLIRRPQKDDADAIFRRYSSDPDVTRYLGWPRHHFVDEVLAFITFSDGHWEQ